MTPAEIETYLIDHWATTPINLITQCVGMPEWEIRLVVNRLRAEGRLAAEKKRGGGGKCTLEKAAARRRKSDLPPRRLVDVTGKLDGEQVRTARDQVAAILAGWGVLLEWRRVGREDVPYLDGKAASLAVLCARWEAEWERAQIY